MSEAELDNILGQGIWYKQTGSAELFGKWDVKLCICYFILKRRSQYDLAIGNNLFTTI